MPRAKAATMAGRGEADWTPIEAAVRTVPRRNPSIRSPAAAKHHSRLTLYASVWANPAASRTRSRSSGCPRPPPEGGVFAAFGSPCADIASKSSFQAMFSAGAAQPCCARDETGSAGEVQHLHFRADPSSVEQVIDEAAGRAKVAP